MKNRITTLILTALLSLIGSSAFAQTIVATIDSWDATTKTRSTAKNYTSFKAARQALKEGQTLTLKQPCTCDSVLNLTNDTIVLNNWQLTFAANCDTIKGTGVVIKGGILTTTSPDNTTMPQIKFWGVKEVTTDATTKVTTTTYTHSDFMVQDVLINAPIKAMRSNVTINATNSESVLYTPKAYLGTSVNAAVEAVDSARININGGLFFIENGVTMCKTYTGTVNVDGTDKSVVNSNILLYDGVFIERETYNNNTSADKQNIKLCESGDRVYLLGGITKDEVTDASLTYAMPPTSASGRYTYTRAAAQVGETKYSTFTDAMTAWTSGKMTLLNTATWDEQINIDASKTLDLYGFNLTYTGTAQLTRGFINVNYSHDLALNASDGTTPFVGDSIKIGYQSYTYDDVQLMYTNPTPVIGVSGGSENTTSLSMNGGTLCGAASGITGFAGEDKTNMVINGGIIGGEYAPEVPASFVDATGNPIELEGSATYGIYHPQDGTLTINKGTTRYDAETAANITEPLISGMTNGIEMRAGNLTIHGGTINSVSEEQWSKSVDAEGPHVTGAAVAICQGAAGSTMDITIDGGTFGNAEMAEEGQGSIAVYEKSFDGTGDNITANITQTTSGEPAVTEPVFNGAVILEDATNSGNVKNDVAWVYKGKDAASGTWMQTTYYKTLQDAVTAAQGNANYVVRMLSDITVTEPIVINGAMTLNMSAHTLTGDGCTALKVADGNVIIRTTLGDGNFYPDWECTTTQATITNTGAANGDMPVIQIGCNDSAAAMKENNPGSAAPALDIKPSIIVTSALSPVFLFKGNDTSHTLTTSASLSAGDMSAKDVVISQTGVGNNAYPAITGLNSQNALTHTAATTITLSKESTVSSTNANAIYHPQRGTLTVNGTVTGLGGIEMKDGTLTLGATATVTATAAEGTYKLLKKDDTQKNVCSSYGFAVAMVKNPVFLPGSTQPFKYTCTEGATVTGAVGIVEEAWIDSDQARLASLTISPYEASLVGWADSSHPSSYNISLLYSTLQDAIDAAKSGETVTVQSAVTLNNLVTIDKPLTINLNRKTVDASDKSACIEVSKDASGTIIKNGTITRTNSSTDYRQVLNILASATLSGITMSVPNICVEAVTDGIVLDVENCNFTSTNDYVFAIPDQITLNINSGTYTCNVAKCSIFTNWNYDNPKINVSGGYFNFTGSQLIYSETSKNLTLNCTGGYYSDELSTSYYDTDNYFTKKVSISSKDWYKLISNNIAIKVEVPSSGDLTFNKYSEFATYRASNPNALGIVADDDSDALPAEAVNIISQRTSYSYYYCKNMELTDMKDFYFPHSSTPIKVDELTYTRTNTKGYNTVCLPFAITATDVQAEENGLLLFSSVDKKQNNINFTSVDKVTADQMPCLVKSTADSWTITKQNVDVYGQAYNSSKDNTYVGAFSKALIGAGYYKLDGTGTKFVKTKSDSTIKPFRGYMYFTDDVTPESLNIAIDAAPTAIDAVDAVDVDVDAVEAIYSVNGAKLNSMQKGINILRMTDGTIRKVSVK